MHRAIFGEIHEPACNSLFLAHVQTPNGVSVHDGFCIDLGGVRYSP